MGRFPVPVTSSKRASRLARELPAQTARGKTMWYRIANELRCPLCGGGLRCEVFDDEPAPLTADIRALAAQLDVWSEDFNRSVREGLLLCDACQTWFPITRRVPVLLPYALPLHTAFLQDWNSCIAKLSKSYQFPNVEPMPGERQVLESFSKEWLEYSYDGVLLDQHIR